MVKRCPIFAIPPVTPVRTINSPSEALRLHSVPVTGQTVPMLGSDDEGTIMLKARSVATRLPAQDLNRARAFYADKLGLEPSEERPGGLLYRCAGSEFGLFASAGASPGTFTQMGVDGRRHRGDSSRITQARRGFRGVRPSRA